MKAPTPNGVRDCRVLTVRPIDPRHGGRCGICGKRRRPLVYGLVLAQAGELEICGACVYPAQLELERRHDETILAGAQDLS